MINAIIEAISIILNKEFGDEYEIHMEEIKQGLKEPCFFITCLNPTIKQFFGKRYFRSNQFCIQYFPESDEKKRECNDVAEKVITCLEYLLIPSEDSSNNLIRGTKMKYEIVDNILNFFVNYDCFIYAFENSQDEMNGMESIINTKAGD